MSGYRTVGRSHPNDGPLTGKMAEFCRAAMYRDFHAGDIRNGMGRDIHRSVTGLSLDPLQPGDETEDLS